MEFSFHEPPAQLSASVKTIWCARGTRQEFDSPEPIVPDGCVELIFNLGDPFINAETGDRQPRDLLAGQMTRPVVALPTGHVDLIGVRFHTGRAGAAFGMAMWELQDQLVAASEVKGGFGKIAERISEEGVDDRLTRLGTLLVEQLHSVDASGMAQIDQALAMIDRSRGTTSIEHIANAIGISRRQLERQFRDHVGLGAKHLARITRVHSALNLLQQQPLWSGAEIAATCGYSDQAHLIRECQALAGRTPERLKSTDASLAALMREAI